MSRPAALGRLRPSERRARDAGSMTVFALQAAAVCMGCAYLVTLCATILLAGARARTAADLAALAAADALGNALPPCPAAERVAEANFARLVSCTPGQGAVGVVVEVPVPWLAGGRPARASARAEPGRPALTSGRRAPAAPGSPAPQTGCRTPAASPAARPGRVARPPPGYDRAVPEGGPPCVVPRARHPSPTVAVSARPVERRSPSPSAPPRARPPPRPPP